MSAPRVLDLTRPLGATLATYPDDPPLVVEPWPAPAESPYRLTRLSLGTHTGTHLDAPRHLRALSAPLESIGLDRLVGPAALVDARRTRRAGLVDVADLAPYHPRIDACRRVLLWTEASTGPPSLGLTPAAATWLVARGVVLVGIDTPSINSASEAECLLVHEILLRAGVAIVENLANLSQLAGETFTLVVLPLALAGVDGAPVRAVALREGTGVGNV